MSTRLSVLLLVLGALLSIETILEVIEKCLNLSLRQ